MTQISARERVGYYIYAWDETASVGVPDRTVVDYMEIAWAVLSPGLAAPDDLWRVVEAITEWDSQPGQRRCRDGYLRLADVILAGATEAA